MSALVAKLYPEGGSRRDAGFSLFYMGINVGALLGALLVPIFAARFGWHWGFALPALGMTLGLVQFVVTRHYLSAYDRPEPLDTSLRRRWQPVAAFGVAALLVAALILGGAVSIDPRALAASGLLAHRVTGRRVVWFICSASRGTRARSATGCT